MNCPICSKKTTVTDSRNRADGVKRRRRACRDCGHIFTTLETIRDDTPEDDRNIWDVVKEIKGLADNILKP